MKHFRIYIVDDDEAIIKSLQFIIEENDLGIICGFSSDPLVAIQEIQHVSPDIVIIDYLMPELDGVELIRTSRYFNSKIRFMMLSKVSDKDMIADAYKTGIEFFITKPINVIEIKTVLKNLSKRLEMERTIESIHGLIMSDQHRNRDTAPSPTTHSQIHYIKVILNNVGIRRNKGYTEIIRLCEYIIDRNLKDNQYDLKKICSELSMDYKTSIQRMRRSVSKGLTNMAHMGLEDYMNEYFVEYSNALYGFENVRAEMDHIRGNKLTGGRVNVNKFINSLIIKSESMMAY